VLIQDVCAKTGWPEETKRGVDYVVVENYRLLSIEMGLGVNAENAGCRNVVVFPREKVRCDALQSTKRDDKDFSMFLLEGGVD
jgi:hypothetical protein